MEPMERCQKRITFYQWNSTSDAGWKEILLSCPFCLLMMALKTVKTEKAKCVVFGNFIIVCAGERGGGLLEKMIGFFFTMTENSCSSKVPKVLQSSLLADC